MIARFKRILPGFALQILRNLRKRIYQKIDKHKPYLNKINYCGFDVYYSRGSGLIDRIRFGNVDRIYERDLCDRIVGELSKFKRPVFLDIGANVGLVSLYVLYKISSAKIYAFEPTPHQYKLFDITIFANRLNSKIFLYKEALSNEIGKKKFCIHCNTRDSSGDGFLDTKRTGNVDKIVIDTITLDKWWRKNNELDIHIIKIDTEGAELWILDGARQLIKKCQPVIFLEIAIPNLKVYPYSHLDILDWLNKNNYELFTLNNKICTMKNFNYHVTTNDIFIAKSMKYQN